MPRRAPNMVRRESPIFRRLRLTMASPRWLSSPHARKLSLATNPSCNASRKCFRSSVCGESLMTKLHLSLYAGFTAVALLSGATAYAAAAIPDLSGTYWATTYYPKVQVVGGGDPPLNEAGKAEYRKNQAGLRNGSIEDPVRKLCLLDG